jgi:hypothetical protein
VTLTAQTNAMSHNVGCLRSASLVRGSHKLILSFSVCRNDALVVGRSLF